MSYCPEHGELMELLALCDPRAVYACRADLDAPEVWVYDADEGTYSCPKEQSFKAADCPNCDRKSTPLIRCDGCQLDICGECWAEHELDIPCRERSEA